MGRVVTQMDVSNRYIRTIGRKRTKRKPRLTLGVPHVPALTPYPRPVPTPRRTSYRATRIRGDRPTEPARSGSLSTPSEQIADPARPRSVIDYALARRSALEALRSGVAFTSDPCDADPYLLRAAKNHGEATERPCPVCQRGQLVHVTYVFGEQLGPYSGRIKASGELPQMAHEIGEFRVYVVEVCQGCSWNHLHISYTLGDGTPRRIPRRPADLLD